MTIRDLYPGPWIGGVAMLAAGLAGCASVGQLTNADAPACSSMLARQLSAVLLEQGEKTDTADALAERTTRALRYDTLGPRPFELSSPSGVDYAFFIEPKDGQCLLRLYGRQKGFTRYTNNLTYIATKPLAPCTCSE